MQNNIDKIALNILKKNGAKDVSLSQALIQNIIDTNGYHNIIENSKNTKSYSLTLVGNKNVNGIIFQDYILNYVN